MGVKFQFAGRPPTVIVGKSPTVVTKPSCSHRGKGVQVGEYTIYAGGSRDLRPDDYDQFDIVIPLDDQLRTAQGQMVTVLTYYWEDMKPPPEGFVKFLKETVIPLLEQGKKLLVNCTGGHGRTGTFLATLVAILEPKTKDPIEAVRTRHCNKAVETNAQAQFIFDLLGRQLPKKYAKMRYHGSYVTGGSDHIEYFGHGLPFTGPLPGMVIGPPQYGTLVSGSPEWRRRFELLEKRADGSITPEEEAELGDPPSPQGADRERLAARLRALLDRVDANDGFTLEEDEELIWLLEIPGLRDDARSIVLAPSSDSGSLQDEGRLRARFQELVVKDQTSELTEEEVKEFDQIADILLDRSRRERDATFRVEVAAPSASQPVDRENLLDRLLALVCKKYNGGLENPEFDELWELVDYLYPRDAELVEPHQPSDQALETSDRTSLLLLLRDLALQSDFVGIDPREERELSELIVFLSSPPPEETRTDVVQPWERFKHLYLLGLLTFEQKAEYWSLLEVLTRPDASEEVEQQKRRLEELVAKLRSSGGLTAAEYSEYNRLLLKPELTEHALELAGDGIYRETPVTREGEADLQQLGRSLLDLVEKGRKGEDLTDSELADYQRLVKTPGVMDVAHSLAMQPITVAIRGKEVPVGQVVW